MFNDISNFTNVTARRGLYQVWIRAQEHENARLVAVWIDPKMRAFESQVADEKNKLPACTSSTSPITAISIRSTTTSLPRDSAISQGSNAARPPFC
jgi:hypothetical protein